MITTHSAGAEGDRASFSRHFLGVSEKKGHSIFPEAICCEFDWRFVRNFSGSIKGQIWNEADEYIKFRLGKRNIMN
jgi:hypothetical protein